MELRIKKIQNAGDISSEFIELTAIDPVNLKNFILSDSYNTHSTKIVRNHTYWFPELIVNAGTTIRLNTRKGLNNLKLANLYWNLDEPLWKDKLIAAYLIRIDDYLPFPDSKGFSDSLFLSLIHISEPTRPY